MNPLLLLGVVLIVGVFAHRIARTVSAGRTKELRSEIERMKRLLDGLAEDVQTLKRAPEKREFEVKEVPETVQVPPPKEVEPEAPSPVPAEALRPEEREELARPEAPREEQQVPCSTCGARWPAGTKFCTTCGTFLETGKRLVRAEEKEPIAAAAPAPVARPEAAVVAPPPTEKAAAPARAITDWIRRKTAADREWLKKLEEAAGRRWITWVGAVVLFLSAGFFVKYAFEHRWLGETARVILGVIAGLAVTAAGNHFLKRNMRALGQGLVGAGLAILYVSLYAASGVWRAYGIAPRGFFTTIPK